MPAINLQSHTAFLLISTGILMAQFDYYANTDKDTNTTYPFIVDVQDALLDGLNSRAVIP